MGYDLAIYEISNELASKSIYEIEDLFDKAEV